MRSHAISAAAVVPFLLGAATLHAADRSLGLAETTERALAKNQAITIERGSFQIGVATLEEARGSYDPTFNLDGRYRHGTDPVNSIFSGAPEGELGTSREGFAADAGLRQLLPTGGTLSATVSAARDRTNNSFVPISPAYSTSIGVDLRQPLLQNFFIDPSRRAVRIASLGVERSAASLARTVIATVADVEKVYWTLAAAQRDVAIRRDAVQLADEQLSETQARIDAGTLSESDFAQPRAEVERRKGELYSAEETAKRTELLLKSLILDDASDPLWSESLVPSDLPELRTGPVDLAAALASAEAKRPELRDAALNVAQQDVQVQAAKDRVKPQLDLVASYARRGLAGSLNTYAPDSFNGRPVTVADDLQGSLGNSFGSIGDGTFPDASIGLSLSIPIGNRSARAGAVIARVRREQAQTTLVQARQQVAVDVRNAALALETAAQRVEAARAGREAAEVQLRAEKERYAVGLSTNFFVLTRQNDLSSARVTEVTANADHVKARTDFARAAGTLLEERNITITDGAPAGPATGVSR